MDNAIYTNPLEQHSQTTIENRAQQRQVWLRRISVFSVVLAFTVVILGAYTRLADAGLGCPDWPGCYGHLGVPKHADDIAAAQAAFPESAFDASKAWIEMVHRYFASSLGLAIIALLWMCWRQNKTQKNKEQHHQAPVKLAAALLALVVFQGLLGMWTVTLGLFPTVVMGHLLGGFTTLTLLSLLAIRLRQPFQNHALQGLIAPRWYGVVIAILSVQIALGGWTAANYAATVCTGLPICQGDWSQHLNFADAFQFWGHGLQNYEFGIHLRGDAKITIHVAHRIGAIIASLAVLIIVIKTLSKASLIVKRLCYLTLAILVTQIALGVSNVVFQLPLAVAVAHNAVAALLLISLVGLCYAAYQQRKPATAVAEHLREA